MQLHERLGRDLFSESEDAFSEIRNRIHGAVIAALGPRLSQTTVDQEALRTRVAATIRAELEAEAGLARPDRDRLVGEITDEVLGHGPLERLLSDESISEIMVNGHAEVWIERNGRIELAPARFVDDIAPAPDHQQDGRGGRPPHRRVVADGRRAAARRLARQRDHPAAVADGPAA